LLRQEHLVIRKILYVIIVSLFPGLAFAHPDQKEDCPT